MKKVNFEKYDFPTLQNGRVLQKNIKSERELKEYLLNLIKCDFDDSVKVDVFNFYFKAGQKKYILKIES